MLGEREKNVKTVPHMFYDSAEVYTRQSGQTNLISGRTDPTDPVFVESRKKYKTAQKFLYACKKSKLIARLMLFKANKNSCWYSFTLFLSFQQYNKDFILI